MKKNIIAGFNVSCVGDDRSYGYVPTRNGGTYVDKIVCNILSFKHPGFIQYSFLDRSRSDERQYNSPGVDLPVCCVVRTKFGSYPEYHTSLDNLNLINPEGLLGSYDVLSDCLELIERDHKYKTTCLGEPQLGKRGLYPTISTKFSVDDNITNMKNFVAYADGKNDLADISNKIGVSVGELYPIIDKLLRAKLIKITN